MRKQQSIYHKLRDLDENIVNDNGKLRFLASVLIALSGFLLYADKALVFFDFSFDIPQRFAGLGMEFETFVWIWCQTLSPILIIMGSVLRPYIYSYLVPIFCYILQIFFLFYGEGARDYSYIGLYTLGSSLLVFAAVVGVKSLFDYQIRKEIKKMRKELLDE